ncbi:MAG: T9SS type A sorting domain-containing protein [Calditrichaeota bacterium]|nr:T9SS type A sorting domain-containing protein [Calditrichota bacterium]MCB9367368.1 T9SS type A sorting domain-containing protein [Calditrichota bacterium]MCB9391334.1 T9SS type A sorting domain-containing protein [Calditrichota bacterium]
MHRIALIFLLAVGIGLAQAAPSTTKALNNVKPIDGSEQPTFQNIPDPSMYGPRRDALDDPVGVIYQAGTTWYDYQHNGSSGKMVDVDDLGFVHVTWTNGLNSTSSSRHVYYNVWDPSTEAFTISNGQVNSASRGGYVCGQVLPGGFFFPAFHQEILAGQPHAASSIDLIERAGAYTTFEIPYIYEGNQAMQVIWPKIAIALDSTLHVVSTESPLSNQAGDPQSIYYSRGTPVFDGPFGVEILWDDLGGAAFQEIDTCMVISPDIACSRQSNRVVIAWSDTRDDLTDPNVDPTQYNNDIKYIISEDGGDNWSEPVNVTHFIYPDEDCASGDTLVCDADTFRSYTDCSVIFDEDDDIHIAFMTVHYYSLEGTISRYASQIWHWSSDSGYVSPIFAVDASYGDTNWADDLGDWQYVLQRPNLAIDTETDELYCCFVLADENNWSAGGIPMQDVWVSKSGDDGVSWTYATNMTNTNTGQFVPPGESAHERDATLSETVTTYDGDRYLHMSYVFDLDAGGAVGDNPTGTPTLNPMNYQRIRVSDIQSDSLWDNQWPVLHVDSTDMPPEVASFADERPSLPNKFTLHQNYPNPFNPSTTIQFDLAQAARVTLKVFNVLGEEVAVLLSDASRSAGVQLVNFDASGMASGVYLYQIESQGLTQTRKMVLMK